MPALQLQVAACFSFGVKDSSTRRSTGSGRHRSLHGGAVGVRCATRGAEESSVAARRVENRGAAMSPGSARTEEAVVAPTDYAIREEGSEVTGGVGHYPKGMVLRPSEKGAPDAWDVVGVSAPTVIKLEDRQLMFYYSRPGDELGQGVQVGKQFGLPFGWTGMAESTDGVSWQKVRGPLKDPPGPVMGPAEDRNAFDSVAVGVGDVIVHPKSGELWMYYFGADLTPTPRFGGGGEMVGAYMRIGLATSKDGMTWHRRPEPILSMGAEGEWDAKFAAFPKVVPPRTADEEWRLYYHSVSNKAKFSVGLATSPDGITWSKYSGNPVTGPTDDDAWDSDGIATRHVVRVGSEYIMAYEGVKVNLGTGKPPTHDIGLARSPDGINWTRIQRPGGQPGGPILTGEGWEVLGIGTPHIVLQGNGRHRMYYVGFPPTGKSCIGVAELQSNDWLTWKRLQRPD